MKLVFFGSPPFAVPALRLLNEHHEIALVVTQPDRKRGRGQRYAPTAVKTAALDLGLPVLATKRIKSGELPERAQAISPDYFIVTAYGRILPQALLKIPRYGALNIHPSRLPLYRGPAPVNWALLNGEVQTGVAIMEINEEMDAGDILRLVDVEIDPHESAGELLERCAHLGAETLNACLLEEERLGFPLPRHPQDHAKATYASFLDTKMAQVSWRNAPKAVAGLIRAMDPKPGAYTYFGERRLKLYRPRIVDYRGGVPGEVLGLHEGGVVIACEGGALAIEELQLPGKRRMKTSAALAGNPLPKGIVLE